MKLLSVLFFFGIVKFVDAQNPVVIELFTSQGCSSCPAADKNLVEIIEKAETTGQKVYGLSFHVGYWNYIGWKDPYSSAEFTERQKKYASIKSLESIYTPQMIVNGETEFVGSDKRTGSNEVDKALREKMQFQISLKEIKKLDGKILVSYSLDKNPTDETINLAIVEKNAGNEVTRGENSGRKLIHRNVVRLFTTLPAQKEGSFEMNFPRGIKNGEVILFLQNKHWRIIGATGKIF
ncbi:MAG: DUF1223 domain-containing protein [Bacteroidetes bacterium]|nr:DUF1223 domain-containing protein [Bacteroidota bacterium]